MTAILFEPELEGHRLHFVGVIAEALAAHRIPFTLALAPGVFESPEGKSHLPAGLAEGDYYVVGDRTPDRQVTYDWTDKLVSILRMTRKRHVLVPTADGIAQRLGMHRLPEDFSSGKRFLHGTLIRSAFAYPQLNWFRSWRARLSLRMLQRAPWHQLTFLDPLGFDFVVREGMAGRFRNIGVMPEPIEEIAARSKSDARRELGIPEEGRIIGCAGRIDARKGVDLLIRAFAASQTAPEDRLLLVGRHSPPVTALLQGEYAQLVRSGRIISRDQFAESSVFERVFYASDVVAVGYPEHIGSSGILLRAVRCNRPVLASRFGWIGWVTRHFGLGHSVQVTDLAAFSRAILRSLDEAPWHRSTESVQRLMAFHSRQNFQNHWVNSILSVEAPERVQPVVDWHQDVMMGEEIDSVGFE